MCCRVIGCVETRYKVVLENPRPELGVDDADTKDDDDEHEASDELQPSLDKLHRPELHKRLDDEVHDVLCVHEQEEEEEHPEPVVVGCVDLKAVCRIPDFVELLGDLHGEGGEPHRKHETELGRVKAEDVALGLPETVEDAKPE